MNKLGLCNTIKLILRIASKYASEHASSLKAMEATYVKVLGVENRNEVNSKIILSISRYGSIFKVTQQFYLGDELRQECFWLATYGWHSNGHLIEIGGFRYCIFDPSLKTLYLEGYNDADIKTLETFRQI